MIIFILQLVCLIMLPIFSLAASVQPQTLALPFEIKNNQSIWLACGKIYSGELNLEGKENISIATNGRCGPATITPAQPISGWKQEKK